MNIFYLDHDPRKAAEYHCDKHVSKMIVEYGQLMSTAHRMIDGEHTHRLSKSGSKLQHWIMESSMLDAELYLPTHFNHPSAKWVRECADNYAWLYNCFKQLARVFEYRYGKAHATYTKLRHHLSSPPAAISRSAKTPIGRAFNANALPHCNVENDVEAYRRFYVTKRGRMPMIWNKDPNNKPQWFNELCLQVPELR